jgi:hypothetical protein
MKTVIARLAPIPARKVNTPKGHEVLGAKPDQVRVNKAAEVLQDNHPLNQSFLAWCKGLSPTKRKAREFCRLMHISRAA